jgi:hypothetical protein
MIISRSIPLRIKNVSEKICDRVETHFHVQLLFSKIVLFLRYVEIYCRAMQTTDDNTARAHCMLEASGYKHYKHTLRIHNTYSFSTAAMVTQARLCTACLVKCNFDLIHCRVINSMRGVVLVHRRNVELLVVSVVKLRSFLL